MRLFRGTEPKKNHEIQTRDRERDNDEKYTEGEKYREIERKRDKEQGA